MNKTNRKGEGTSGFGWLFGAAGLLLALVIAWILFSRTNTTIDSTDVYTSLKNSDGDSFMDALDDCPCGTDNVKQEINNKAWCLASYSEVQCKCANEFANSARKIELKKKYKTAEDYFHWDASSGKCLYMKEQGCKYLLYAEQNDLANNVGTTCKVLP